MKLSVSLSEEDLAIVDRFVAAAALESRSAAIQYAIRRLPDPELEEAYAAAWDEWTAADGDRWDVTVADGLVDEAR